MRCKTCHYSLANLSEHRCPECGNPFDPNDPSTLAGDDSRFDKMFFWLKIAWIVFLFVAIGLLWSWFMFPGDWLSDFG